MDVIAYVQLIKTNNNFYESVQENRLAVLLYMWSTSRRVKIKTKVLWLKSPTGTQLS